MACRSVEKAEAARKLIKNGADIEICELDLSDLVSVKKFATTWGSRPLHVLACNAGSTHSNCSLASFFVCTHRTPHSSSHLPIL
jgi:NAD(P)-dependent dehydrogenase (short-subunit alcohol dehydrogenase family)